MTRVVSDAMSSLLTYSGEMFSIDPTMCFNVERVTSKSRIVCCEQAPSGPGRILVKLVIFLNSEMQCFEETIYLPNYNNGLFSGERLHIGSWLIPSVNTKNSQSAWSSNHFQFVLHFYIFHWYLFIDKSTEKGMYLVIQERFSSNIWYVTIFCEYPVSLKLLLNILYPNNVFLK